MEASKSDVFWKPSDNCTIGFFSKETKWENAQPAYSGMSSGDKLRGDRLIATFLSIKLFAIEVIFL